MHITYKKEGFKKLLAVMDLPQELETAAQNNSSKPYGSLSPLHVVSFV